MTMHTSTEDSVVQRFNNYKASKTVLLWACGMTAVATMVVGFSWGGWMTGGSALKAATDAGVMATRELAAAVCVDRFKAAPDSSAKLVELRALPDSYKKRQFIEAGGWATMPGQTSADSNISEGCSAALST
jgi:dienelactone hydrolase